MQRNKVNVRKKKLFISGSVIILLTSVMVWTITILIRPILLNYLIDIESIKDSAVQETVFATGLLIKEEKVIKAPLSGQVSMLVDNGERVAAGTEVAKVTRVSLISPEGSKEKTIYAPCAGVVSTNIDGLEGVLQLETANVLELSQIDKIRTELTDNKQQQAVEKGQPIIKLVENLKPVYLYLEVDKKDIPAEQLSQDKSLRLKHKNSWFTGYIVKTTTVEDKQSVLLKVNECPGGLIQLRDVNIEVLRKELTGFIVSEESLVYRNGKPGLYKLYKKKATWVPIDLQGVLKGKAAVSSGNLINGNRYIISPQLIKDRDIITTQ
ncbi:MAG: hypothetical protein FH758_10885 [Firmicutes bacterium]|nr:hypothetical protein [Bacillota bacterium]